MKPDRHHRRNNGGVVEGSGGRIVVVGMSKHGAQGGLVNVFEWAHKHFPQFLDCRPIYVRRALVAAGFAVRRALTRRMWVPVEIVLGVKT